MSAGMDGEKIKLIVDDMKLLVSTTAKIDTRTKEILSEVKAIKKAKESGSVFGKSGDKENKGKIIDGIKIIMLIAVGVLAIGMAFKIIGNVNVASVIALGIAMYAISKSFETIANIKGLTSKKAFLASGIMILMSFTLMVSSFFLFFTAPISFLTALSIVFISVTLGIMMFILVKAFEKVDLTNAKVLKNILLSPIIFPIISLAIVISSYVLQLTQPIDFKTGLSALFVAVVLGAVAYILLTGLSKLDFSQPKMMKNVLLSPLILPIIALAIVLSSVVFQAFQPLQNPWQIVVGSIVMGLALVIFGGVIVAFNKLGIGFTDIIKGSFGILAIAVTIVLSSVVFQAFQPIQNPFQMIGSLIAMGLAFGIFGFAIVAFKEFNISLTDILKSSLGMLAIATTIVLSSYILNQFKKIENPFDLMGGSIAMGIALIAFLPAIWVLSKIDPVSMLMGIAGTVLVAAAIVAASYILSVGKYEVYPGLAWSAGVGLSLLAFSVSAIELGVLAMTGVGAVAIVAGLAIILLVSASIVKVAEILATGNYSGGPSASWAAGTGVSLLAFSLSAIALGAVAITGVGAVAIAAGLLIIPAIAKSISEVGAILAQGTYTGGPTKAWAEGVGTAIVAFSTALKAQSDSGGIFSGQVDFPSFIKNVAGGIVEAGKALNGIAFTGGPTKAWSEGVGTAINAFANALNAANGSFVQTDMRSFINKIAGGMIDMNTAFQGVTFSGGPNSTWIKQINDAVNMMANITKTIGDPQIESVNKFAFSIRNLADSLANLNVSGISKLSSFTGSLNIISTMNPVNMSNNINSVDANKDKLYNITNVIDGGKGKQDQTLVDTQTGGTKGQQSKSELSQAIDKMEKMLVELKAIHQNTNPKPNVLGQSFNNKEATGK
jgi:hypothetical protein